MSWASCAVFRVFWWKSCFRSVRAVCDSAVAPGGEKSRGAFAGLSQLMSATQPDDDELAALCSGRFAGDSNSALFSSDTSTKLDAPLSQTAGFLQTQTSSQDNVNELMGLCSGQFPKAMR